MSEIAMLRPTIMRVTCVLVLAVEVAHLKGHLDKLCLEDGGPSVFAT